MELENRIEIEMDRWTARSRFFKVLQGSSRFFKVLQGSPRLSMVPKVPLDFQGFPKSFHAVPEIPTSMHV